jgi:hypothetical protein
MVGDGKIGVGLLRDSNENCPPISNRGTLSCAAALAFMKRRTVSTAMILLSEVFFINVFSFERVLALIK